MPTAIDIKGQVHAVGALDARINFVFHPVLGHFLVDHAHIPRISRPEVATPAVETKSALCTANAEHRVGPADRSALPVRHDIAGFLRGLRLRLALSSGRLRRWLFLGVLFGNRNRLWLFHLGLWFRLREP